MHGRKERYIAIKIEARLIGESKLGCFFTLYNNRRKGSLAIIKDH
jgi:hypothetical protein